MFRRRKGWWKQERRGLTADLGSFGLEVAVQACELRPSFGIRFDELPAAVGDLLRQLRHAAVWFGLPPGSSFSELSETFVSATTAGCQ